MEARRAGHDESVRGVLEHRLACHAGAPPRQCEAHALAVRVACMLSDASYVLQVTRSVWPNPFV